jgi:hypothetical protein
MQHIDKRLFDELSTMTKFVAGKKMLKQKKKKVKKIKNNLSKTKLNKYKMFFLK